MLRIIKKTFLLIYWITSKVSMVFIAAHFLLFININKRRKIFIFDIDNTLADSWRSSLCNKKLTRRELLSGIAVFINMRNLICQIIQNPHNKVIFLTARRFHDLPVTYHWLRSVGIQVSIFDVLICNHASSKIWLMKLAVNFFAPNIIYVDDLTYNHENGDIKTYPFVKDLDSLPIQYFGSGFISNVHNLDIENPKNYETIFRNK